MSNYVDGFIIPVPKDRLDDYKKMARKAGKIWMEYGALSFFECVGDDVPAGKVTSFPKAVKLKKGEVPLFSFIIYKSRAQRDKVNKKVMADPRMDKMMCHTKPPFDPKRMIWGGFKPVVKLNTTKRT